jgi:hypothetical protein
MITMTSLTHDVPGAGGAGCSIEDLETKFQSLMYTHSDLLHIMMQLDWVHVDLKRVYNVLYASRLPIMSFLKYHCDQLIDVDITPIDFTTMYDWIINVSNGSLRVLIFIVLMYEKPMCEIPCIVDLYEKRVENGRDVQWIVDLFERLNQVIICRFRNICQTKSFKDILKYQKRFGLQIEYIHLSKNPQYSKDLTYTANKKTL